MQTQVHNLALSHFVMYRAFLPYIKDVDGSSYTFFTGGLGAPSLLILAVRTIVHRDLIRGASAPSACTSVTQQRQVWSSSRLPR